ncbi:MAG TPA: zinc-binding dehydrogenase [Kofleriaceae bacterium]|nr:zinc-binding dehydrogenase [Kofleriaceae bacterium]
MSRVVQVTGRGGPEVLEVVDRPAPEPRAGQVRIAVAAAGVAYGDVVRRKGLLVVRHPFTPGYDVAGVIDAVGDGGDATLVGMPAAVLMPRAGIGGYAEHVCVPAERIVRLPAGLDPAIAVCLGLNYITAHQLIHRIVGLHAGQRVLIHGAAGGVGTALVDIGSRAGLVLYGTASAGKHALLHERGVTAIDYRSEDFVARIAELTGDGVDACFDPIGGEHLHRSYRTLRAGGTLVAFGVSGDVDAGLLGLLSGTATMARLRLRRDGRHLRLYLITLTPGSSWQHCRDDWTTLLAQHAAGELHPIVGARIPLADVRRAHEMIDAAAVAGKIVLTP